MKARGSKTKKLIIQDSADIKNVLLQLDFKSGRVMVYSNFSAWDNLAYLLEGVGMMAQECYREGRSKEEVLEEINDYLEKVLQDYEEEERVN